MWQTARRAAVTAAFLVGTLSIACAQTITAMSAARGTAGAGAQTNTTAGGAGAGPANTTQGSGKGAARRGSLMPCRSGPPYTSRPCSPVKR